MQQNCRRYGLFVLLLIACFSPLLFRWLRFALNSGLFSYTLLVPFICCYLAWLRRDEFFGAPEGPRAPAACSAIAGALLLVLPVPPPYRLTCQILSFCLFLWAGGFLFFGGRRMRILAFPALFLAFMAPIPEPVVGMMEAALQHSSAGAAYAMIKLSGLPVHRTGMDFHMPRLALSVAPECSGIRSTLILLLTSLIAGNLFLRKRWTRWALALIVFPLGVLRNGFRIMVIANLCIRMDPSYIHSPIHRQGGPLFFVLSLIPFGIVLYLLHRHEASSRNFSASSPRNGR